MADEAIDSWFAQNLFDSQNWYPERLGQRQVIFSRSAGASLLSMAIDPVESVPTWKRLSGKTFTQSFILNLLPMVKSDAEILFLTNPDGAWIEVHVNRKLECAEWSEWILRLFEEIPAKEAGGQMLIILLKLRTGALVFERFDGFEVAYYGPDDLWEEIAAALYGDTGTPARGNTTPPCDASSNPF